MKLISRVRNLLMLGTLVPGFVLHAAPVPVVEAAVGESEYRQSTSRVTGVTSTSSPASLIYQLELLQQEVQELRGIVEQQQYQITQMREEQRDRYLDLDRRLSQFNQSPGSAGTSSVAAQHGVTGGPSGSAVQDEKSAYQTAFELIRNKRYDDAVGALSRYVEDFPSGAYTGNAYYWLGEVQVVKADYQSALQAFGALLDKFPQHRKIPDAKYKLGKVYRELDDTSKSEQLLKEVVDQYAGTTAAKLAEAELRNARL